MRQMSRKSYQFFLIVLCCLVFLPLDGATANRIVAIGDVHGAFDTFVSILREAGLMNNKAQWSGGNTILVQIGDVLDRGPDSRKAMDLIMSLQKQAPKQKGKMIVLLGNHEIMNLIGDLRYVSPKEYASYTDSNSARRRESAYKAYETYLQQRAKKTGKQISDLSKENELEWKSSHPLGFVEHREAFRPTGKYGKWLRTLDAIQIINGNIFLHGGISNEISDLSIEKMNTRIRQEIRMFDGCAQVLLDRKAALPFFTMEEYLDAAKEELERLRDKVTEPERSIGKQLQECLDMNKWLSIHPEGPVWFRGYATWNDTEGSQNINTLLEKYKATRFITGHSVQQDGEIKARFDTKIILIDTGMLSAPFFPGGRASALEINNGKITAIYSGERKPIQ
jgi:hypothetical protein